MSNVFPPSFRCSLTWRAYQKRILDELERHSADRRLHIVAAPGSGKTVLGLEMIRRLGRPTLVLAPTLGLKDQWSHRLIQSFHAGNSPQWISHDLTSPGLLTFETYQGIYAYINKLGWPAFIEMLKTAEIGALVLDEAHHLRQEWWKALEGLPREIPDLFIVSLTATPPYDVTDVEWSRYLSLAGNVDAEVSIPELIHSGDLCPHQDYIYIQSHSDQDQQRIRQHAEKIKSLVRSFCIETGLKEALIHHPAVVTPGSHAESMILNPQYYVSIAVYLQYCQGTVPVPYLEALGTLVDLLPPFDNEWAEHLLTGILFTDRDSFAGHEELIDRIETSLHEAHCIEKKKVLLSGTQRILKNLSASTAKLKAIARIIESESRALGVCLRGLILTERICAEQLGPFQDNRALSRLGVIPIFMDLHRLRIPHVTACAVSGSICIVPNEVAEMVIKQSRTTTPPKMELLWADAGYRVIFPTGPQISDIVAIVTKALEDGQISVVVGTSSLLGEGWDAPCVNTLLLATTTSSYVAVNQLRGRALRRDLRNPVKAANIWHIASGNTRGIDEPELRILRRRFRLFLGPSFLNRSIESGIERMGIDIESIGSLDTINQRMLSLSENRTALEYLWSESMKCSAMAYARPIGELTIPFRIGPRIGIFRHGLSSDNRVLRWFAERALLTTTRKIATAVFATLHDQQLIASGRGRLLYTKSAEGRKELLKASGRFLAQHCKVQPGMRMRWGNGDR